MHTKIIVLLILITAYAVHGATKCEDVLDKFRAQCLESGQVSTLTSVCLEYQPGVQSSRFGNNGDLAVIHEGSCLPMNHQPSLEKHWDVDLRCLRYVEFQLLNSIFDNQFTIASSDYAYDANQNGFDQHAASMISTKQPGFVSADETSIIACGMTSLKLGENVNMSSVRVLSESIHHRAHQERVIIDFAPAIAAKELDCREFCDDLGLDYKFQVKPPRFMFLPFLTVPELSQDGGPANQYFKSSCHCSRDGLIVQ